MERGPAVKPPDLLARSREDLVEAHVIHDFDPVRVLENLKGCYGQLMRERYRRMLSSLKGKRIIDCGCGFGQFSRVAVDAGYSVTSIDIDDHSLAVARSFFGIPCRKESVYATSLSNGSCDSAVCCDSIQHFDIGYFVQEMKRLGVERIVIYDSNISNPVLAGYRALAGHKESNYRTVEQIISEFQEYGYHVVLLRFENIVSLLLSGGFHRHPFPVLHRFPAAIRGLDRMLSHAVRAIGIDRWVAFRFLIILNSDDRRAETKRISPKPVTRKHGPLICLRSP
jgi:SAM-dependent methyltransferase